MDIGYEGFLQHEAKRCTAPAHVTSLAIIPKQQVPLEQTPTGSYSVKCFYVPMSKMFWHHADGYRLKLNPDYHFEDLFVSNAAPSNSIDASELEPLTGGVLAKNRLRTTFVVVRSTLDLNLVKGLYSLGDGEYWLFKKRGNAFKKTAAPKAHLRECCVIGTLSATMFN
jgi:hypothetical protein